jgi:hypothetical protein
VPFFEKITQGLKKTRDALLGQVAAVFQHGRDLSAEDCQAQHQSKPESTKH